MPQTRIATGTFSSRRDANEAVRRLVASGFARNSIALHPHDEDEGCDLEIHTRAENVGRARRLIHASSPMSMRAMRGMASGAVRSASSHPLILLGASVLAGFVIYNLIPRPAPQRARKAGPARAGRRRRRADR